MRNRIINGAMTIDQRNNGASVTASGATYAYQLDRFYSGGLNGSGAFTVQRVTDAPAGFSNSVRMTITTADTSLASNEEYGLQQVIEGNNVFDLNWGTANAQPATLSFWVKSSLTGTFGVAIRNAGTWNRSYVGQYTIAAANTWEYKTVTMPGDTTGTWGTGSSSSVNVTFDFGGGSNFNGTANTWNASGATRVSGNVSLIGNIGATWQVTGVQFEEGTAASPFENRLIGTELALCQRYYVKTGSGSNYTAIGSGFNGTGTATSTYIKFPVSMRASPTVSQSNMAVSHGAFLVTAITSISGTNASTDSANVNFDVASGLSVGGGHVVLGNNNANAFVALTAEL
jgi:hypothetical protein